MGDLMGEGIREVHEELHGEYGIVNYELIDEMKIQALKPKYKGCEITYYIFAGYLDIPLIMPNDRLRPGEEHQAYALLSVEEILKLDITPEAKMVIEKIIKTP